MCRTGLHLGATTVRRILNDPDKRIPPKRVAGFPVRVVTARRPNQTWHCDLTAVPTMLGFWVPWFPQALPLRWPFCWRVAVVMDHYCRRELAFAVFPKEPSSKQTRKLLGRAIAFAGKAPEFLITDHGIQFIAKGFRRWRRGLHIDHRFGAVGNYGSIAIIERFMRTLKSECTRRLIVPFRQKAFEDELTRWTAWYNDERPHEALRAKTPDEVYFRRRPACLAPRFEPRATWPRRSPCAAPQALMRGRPGVTVELKVSYRSGRKHLPVVELRRAA